MMILTLCIVSVFGGIDKPVLETNFDILFDNWISAEAGTYGKEQLLDDGQYMTKGVDVVSSSYSVIGSGLTTIRQIAGNGAGAMFGVENGTFSGQMVRLATVNDGAVFKVGGKSKIELGSCELWYRHGERAGFEGAIGSVRLSNVSIGKTGITKFVSLVSCTEMSESLWIEKSMLRDYEVVGAQPMLSDGKLLYVGVSECEVANITTGEGFMAGRGKNGIEETERMELSSNMFRDGVHPLYNTIVGGSRASVLESTNTTYLRCEATYTTETEFTSGSKSFERDKFSSVVSYGGLGGAITASGTASLTVEYCTFTSCEGTFGGAIYFHEMSGTCLLNRTLFEKCTSSSTGGCLSSGGAGQITGCTFKNSSAEYAGGAIDISRPGPSLVFSENKITWCSTGEGQEGGGIYIFAVGSTVGDVKLQFVWYDSNWAGYGGALCLGNNSESMPLSFLNLSSSAFTGNLADFFGHDVVLYSEWIGVLIEDSFTGCQSDIVSDRVADENNYTNFDHWLPYAASPVKPTIPDSGINADKKTEPLDLDLGTGIVLAIVFGALFLLVGVPLIVCCCCCGACAKGKGKGEAVTAPAPAQNGGGGPSTVVVNVTQPPTQAQPDQGYAQQPAYTQPPAAHAHPAYASQPHYGQPQGYPMQMAPTGYPM